MQKLAELLIGQSKNNIIILFPVVEIVNTAIDIIL